MRGIRFPVGPDGPVYLWWARLAGVEGLSSAERPGVPALILSLSGTLHASVVAATAALQSALGVALGLAAAALTRRADPAGRATWVLGGTLAGLFAEHLVAGYLANLAFAGAFMGAAVALALETRRGAMAAAILLGAGGLAHPQFFLVGAGILALTAAAGFASRSRDGHWLDGEPGRIGVAILGGGALLGAALLALLRGPDPLDVDTSRDAFLRRTGMTDTLRHLYRQRFFQRNARYVQWVSVPLAIFGLREARGFTGRLLRAWGAVTIAGIGVGLATALLPPDRFVTFGYVVPILAAIGVVRLWKRLRARPALATALAAVMVAAMAGGTFITWRREGPYLAPGQVEAMNLANPYLAGLDPGTAIAVLIDNGEPSITFYATQAANTARATVPAGRIRDVIGFVPTLGGEVSDERARIQSDSIDQVDLARAAGHDVAAVGLLPFAGPAYDGFVTGPAALAIASVQPAQGVTIALPRATAETDPGELLRPSSPGAIVVTTLGALLLLALVGYGWARAAGVGPVNAGALAPAFGTAATILAAVALDRAGASLGGAVGATAASALAGGCGYVALFLAERRSRT